MGVRSLGLTLQEIGHGDFSVPGIRDNAHAGLRCRSPEYGIQPCTSPLRRITNFDAQDYKFECHAIRISLRAALESALSIGRRGRANSEPRKRTSHNRRTKLRQVTEKSKPATSREIAS